MTDRLVDPGKIEHRLLEMAYTTDAKITATSLAYFAPCSIEAAGRVLDDLAARDRLRMEVEDDGTVVYEMLGRQKLAPAAPAAPPRPVLVPAVVAPRGHHGPSPVVAGVLSMIVPGAGHLYAGRVGAAVLWFLIVTMGYVLFFPGLVLHLFSIASAASAAHRANVARSLQLGGSRRLLTAGPAV